MIVVSAATGEFGRLVVDQLLNRMPASDVAVAVRDVHKAADLADRGVQVRYGDYDEPDSLRNSFNGADRLLFISAPSFDSAERMQQHHNVVDAARTTGVGHLVYTSGLGADVVDEGGLADELAQVLSDISGRTIINRQVDEDEAIMTMIGPAVRAGSFEHQTDDLERVLGHPSTSLRAAVTVVLQSRS